jgi:hypothetical protein
VLNDPGTLGKVFQLSSALTGGVNAPGVAEGSIPSGGYAQTPEGIANANQLAIQKSAADSASAAAQKPYTYFQNGAPVVTNEAAAAGGRLPQGAIPAIGSDLVKGAAQQQILTPTTQPAAADTGADTGQPSG